MAKRAILILVGVTAGLASFAAAEERKPRSVFLAADPGTKNECLRTLAQTLRGEIDRTPGVEAAQSSDEADVRVEVKECSQAPVDIDADFELHASNGNRQRTRGGSVAVGVGVPGGGAGKVTLTAENGGKVQDFDSGPRALPLSDASRVAVRALLEWVRSGGTN